MTDAVAVHPLPSSSVPASCAYVPSLSDTVELTIVSRGVYVGVTGNVKVTMYGSGTVVFVAVPAGVTLPIRVKQIWSTGTTATSLLVLY